MMLCPDEIFRNDLKLSIAKDNHFFSFLVTVAQMIMVCIIL